MMTLGKWVAGGLPVGMYGMTEKLAKAVSHYRGGAMGSTLAAGAFATHVMRVALDEVITEESYKVMRALASRFEQAVTSLIERHRLPWHVQRLGARVTFAFDPAMLHPLERPFSEIEAQARSQLHEALFLFLANRGVLISGWNCTAIFCPLAEETDVDLLIALLTQAVGSLVARA
jgi:glutamate-1-semialdehyde 2,1-aminomutase